LSCANNLKQIGLALHNYEGTFQKLPPSRLFEGGATWLVMVLPFIEQDNLYYQWNIWNSYYQQNNTARMTPVRLDFCPSRRSASTPPTASISGDQWSGGGPSSPHFPGALSDYAANIGTTGVDYYYQSPSNGAFVLGPSGLGFNAFTDGL